MCFSLHSEPILNCQDLPSVVMFRVLYPVRVRKTIKLSIISLSRVTDANFISTVLLFSFGSDKSISIPSFSGQSLLERSKQPDVLSKYQKKDNIRDSLLLLQRIFIRCQIVLSRQSYLVEMLSKHPYCERTCLAQASRIGS